MYSEKQLAEIDESMKRLTSETCVINLINDFGYKAEFFDMGEAERLAERLAEIKVQARNTLSE